MTAPGDTRVTLALATSGGASRSSKTFRGASLAPRGYRETGDWAADSWDLRTGAV